jgi:hypothetical protein
MTIDNQKAFLGCARKLNITIKDFFKLYKLNIIIRLAIARDSKVRLRIGNNIVYPSAYQVAKIALIY